MGHCLRRSLSRFIMHIKLSSLRIHIVFNTTIVTNNNGDRKVGKLLWILQHGHCNNRMCYGRFILTAGILNIFYTWSQVYSFLSIRGRQCYKWGQFVETPWRHIKNDAILDLLLQTGSCITQQFSLTKVVVNEISDTTFAWVIFQYRL